jgi:hypothetical protein
MVVMVNGMRSEEIECSRWSPIALPVSCTPSLHVTHVHKHWAFVSQTECSQKGAGDACSGPPTCACMAQSPTQLSQAKVAIHDQHSTAAAYLHSSRGAFLAPQHRVEQHEECSRSSPTCGQPVL